MPDFNTNFYLFTEDNRWLYPSSIYLVTHYIAHKNAEQLHKIVKRLSCILFVVCLLVIYFSGKYVPLYDSIFGPFHLNATEFGQYIEDFKNGYHKFEYIQIEMGQNSTPFNAIKKYSNIFVELPETYATTYIKFADPKIYIKLHRTINHQIYERLAFDFTKFSSQTLYCILDSLSNKNVQSSDPANVFGFINSEYDKNVTFFNTVILEKCGIFIGYCKKETIIEAITWENTHPPKLRYLGYDGVVLDSSEPYIPLYSYIVLVLCVLGSILVYQNILTDYASLPLMVNNFFIDELQKLKFRVPVHIQLLKFDEAINNAKYQLKNQLFIIENDEKEDFLVVFSVNRNKIKSYEYIPFLVYKVSDIYKVTYFGIYDVKDGPLRMAN